MRQTKSKTRNSVKRRAVGLNQRLEKRLISYALAAGAAGVSALAGVPHAEAKVVFTNTWVTITPETGTTNIDLNGDGVVDFVIANSGTNQCSSRICSSATLKVLPQGSGNAVWGTNSYASALGSGVSVGSQGKFQAGHEFMGNGMHETSDSGSGYQSRGPWRQTTNHYLGVKFMIQGKVHYGWVRMDVAEADGGIYAAVTGFAYETVPNKSILTGQKSGATKQRHKEKRGSAVDVPAPTQGSLGELALGALGPQSWKGQDVPRK